MKFKANINDLKRVVKPSDSPPSSPSEPMSDDYHVIDDEQAEGQQERDGEGSEEGEAKDKSKPSKITIKGNPSPIIDVIPGDKDTGEIKGLAGSNERGKTPLTKEQIKDALQRAQEAEATEQAGGSGKPGRGIGGRRVAVPTDFPTKTDWARLMINLLSKTKVGPPTFTKPHKRTFGQKLGGTPLMIPGRDKEQDIGKIIVAIDTSGSISDEIIGGFLSELRRIFETFKTSQSFACKIILWADGQYAISEDFKTNQFDKLKQWVFSNVVSGGTSIDPVVKYINSLPNLNEYVGTVWFTDGQIGDLQTRLPNNFNIFVINGFEAEYTRQFFSDLKKFKPAKQITVVKTSYGYGS
jgi:predicted metal-dependent peptidase